MVLTKAAYTKIVRSALAEIGLEFADNNELKEFTIKRVLQQLADVGGTNWDPSPSVLAGLIVLLALEKMNYVPGFNGDWFDENADKTVGDLINHLHEAQISMD